MALPLWNSSAFGKVHLVVDQRAQTFALMTERDFAKKTGNKAPGQFDASNVASLGMLVRHYEGQGYQAAKGSVWTPEDVKGRDDLNPVLKSTKYGQPTLHWLGRPAPAPVKTVELKSISPDDIARILAANQPKQKKK